MTHNDDFNALIRTITEKSVRILFDIRDHPDQLLNQLRRLIEMTENMHSLFLVMLNNPERVWQTQWSYWEDNMRLFQNQWTHWLEGKVMPIEDPRFNTPHWVDQPMFNLMSQQYLLITHHINDLLTQLHYGDKALAKRLQFFTRQYLDALSPANFIFTNPELLAETIETHGQNLLKGLGQLLTDLENGPSQLMIQMTDTKAFKLGEQLATTPGAVIFRNDMMELIQYTPQTTKVRAIPLLIIPPWINKYYILDLSSNNSFIQWLVQQGITVFVISWINPDEQYAKKSFYSYLEGGPRASLDVIKQQMNVTQVNTLGFCIGGTLQAALLAYNQAHGDTTIHSATFLASLIDFSDPGDISVFIDEQQIKELEAEMKEKGYLAGKFMASSFNSLRANDLIWSFFIKNYLRGKNPVPFDILFWNADTTNMPATMHSQYLRWMYLHNKLVKPGKIKLNHTPIDLTHITIPTFFLSTEKDHIAPWKTTYLGFQLMKGPKRFVLGGSGHIAGIINAPTAQKYGYRTNNGAPDTPEEWLEHATEHPGSWWPEWLKWLRKHSGPRIDAVDIKHLPYTPLMDAPGSYVLQKR